MMPSRNFDPTTVRVAGGGSVRLEDYAGDRPLWSSALIGSDQSTDATLFRFAKEKPLYDGLLKHFPGGSGIGGMTTATAVSFFTNGAAGRPDIVRKLAVPLHIGPNKKFKFVMSTPGGALSMGTADILVRTIYRGFRKLSVQ